MSVPNTPRPAGAAHPQGGRPPVSRAHAAPARPFVPQKRSMLPFILICAGVLALGVALQALLPNGFSLTGGAVGGGAVTAVAEIEASDTVQLNEVMTSNGRLFRDAAGRTPDWIEVRNASGEMVELEGWTLARGAEESHMFVFPQRTLAPGECVLVFADSTYADGADGYHAPFSLKAAGDTLMASTATPAGLKSISVSPAALREKGA